MSFTYRYCRALTLIMLGSAAIGCGHADRIETYTVDKEPPRPALSDTASVGDVASATGVKAAASSEPASAADRMLAAILPDGSRAWFFKVVGTQAEVDQHAEQIMAFLASVRRAGNESLPTWKLPSGWSLGPERPMRAATILIPGEKPLELTVSTLGWPGTTDAMLANINRWRGQMQLPPIEADQLATTTKKVKAGDATMTVVDIAGRFQTTMTPPFARGAPFATGEVASATGGNGASTKSTVPTDLPANHPPVDARAEEAAPNGAAQEHNSAPAFDVPKDWKVLPAEGMRRVAFSVEDGPKQAVITVIQLSASAPRIADALDNVNRWRGEVGLARIDKDSLDKVTEPMKIGGAEATYMAAIPDPTKPEESQIPRATLAAMVSHGGSMWFFKMSGARELVAAEQQNFKDFLKSVRFTGERGATDGN